jgi:hypothetical protein
MEITNGGVFPPLGTLEQFDRLLAEGFAVAAVGGSDAHTLSRAADTWEHGTRGILGGEAGVGRSNTSAFISEYQDPAPGYDSRDPNDPVRLAILSGATVASNAGFATAQIAGTVPGSSVTVDGDGDIAIEVLATWQREFTPLGGGPDSIRVILGQFGQECASGACSQVITTGCLESNCAPGIVQDLTVEDLENGIHQQATITVLMPAEWDRAYLRVEVLESESDTPRFGAFTSPWFLGRAS